MAHSKFGRVLADPEECLGWMYCTWSGPRSKPPEALLPYLHQMTTRKWGSGFNESLAILEC